MGRAARGRAATAEPEIHILLLILPAPPSEPRFRAGCLRAGSSGWPLYALLCLRFWLEFRGIPPWETPVSPSKSRPLLVSVRPKKKKGAAFSQSGADTQAAISVAGADCTDTKAAILVAGADCTDTKAAISVSGAAGSVFKKKIKHNKIKKLNKNQTASVEPPLTCPFQRRAHELDPCSPPISPTGPPRPGAERPPGHHSGTQRPTPS